jgi:hypothetical protein
VVATIDPIPSLAGDPRDRGCRSYWIEVRANPTGALVDADASNDVELREVILAGVPGRRTVSVTPYHGIDTEAPTGFGP